MYIVIINMFDLMLSMICPKRLYRTVPAKTTHSLNVVSMLGHHSIYLPAHGAGAAQLKTTRVIICQIANISTRL